MVSCFGFDLQVSKPHLPARVNVYRFDALQPLCPRQCMGQRLNGVKVGHHDSEFRMSDVYLVISVLSLDLVLVAQGIISKAKMKL